MLDIIALARRYATWIERATFIHRLIRELVTGAKNETPHHDGTVTVTLPAAAWSETKHEATEALPQNPNQN